ncbi:MAG TPA: pyridoxal-dependent decarboxylase [Acidobacteriaceae bacterium]|nr:pyridoxal-dependent decarboxylase [Acidobacteriaceae bacterium]
MPDHDAAREEFLQQLREAQRSLDAGFAHLPPAPQTALDDRAAAILQEAATRLRDNDPYGHPLYAGQMLKPPHPIARAAYALAMSINPNNHALDGGRASSAMEIEAVAEIAKMFGWDEHLGHLASGGTFANLEALWIAGQLAREQNRPLGIAASDQAHYTHARISCVLGLPFVSIASGSDGQMNLRALEGELQKGTVGTVVATLGTTATGAVDPLDRIIALGERYNFRLHVDAAYGGYFILAANAGNPLAFRALPDPRIDSIVVDPHKHGLQPYGCGCVLFRDPTAGRFYKHDSPYTYFTSRDLHLGEISLECSRAGASAVALWATQKLLPYTRGGEFARGLEAGCEAARSFYEQINFRGPFVGTMIRPALDIVCWTVRGRTPEESSARAEAIFKEARRRDLYLALAKLPVRYFPWEMWDKRAVSEANAMHPTYVTCLRSVLMKPDHREWLPEIISRLDAAVTAVIG